MNYFYFLLLLLFSITSNGQNSLTIEKKLFFEYNKFVLTEKATQSLDSLIMISNKFSEYNLDVVGYTDASGSIAYNQKLATERSKTVFDYLVKNNLNPSFIKYSGFGVDTKTTNDFIQRNTTITFSAKPENSYYQLNTITGKLGSKVSMKIKNNASAEFTVEEYFSTQSMIANEKFALDTNDEVLETAGMIDIDLKKINPDDIEDGLIQVAIPTISNADYDKEMTVWIEETDKDGKKRWRNIKIKPTWNKNANRYEFSLEASKFRGNRISINLDKNIYRDQLQSVTTGKNKKVIIVATENDEFFYDVYLSYKNEKKNDLKFAAKMDKTGFAFVIPKKVNPKTLTFTGIKSGQEIKFNLVSCRVSKYKNKYVLYKYNSNYAETAKKEKEKEEEKGFWAWVKRIFK